VVKFDRTIKPGEKGRIALSVKIYPEWAGRRWTKRALVVTTDEALNKFALTLTGTVKGVPMEQSLQGSVTDGEAQTGQVSSPAVQSTQ
jgi:mRNA-degrading endonuclease toxin of MazEF toxin-antitoxin module